MPKPRTVTFDCEQYIWNGKRWISKNTRLEPPTSISSKLNTLAAKHIAAQDEEAVNVDALLRKAKKAQGQGDIPKAVKLARQAYDQRPQHAGTVAALCSVLRTANKPREAVALANNFQSSNHPPILTSRAAALCDLNRWDDALKQIRQVFAMRSRSGKSSSSDEAQAVYGRIQQNASYLFDEHRLK